MQRSTIIGLSLCLVLAACSGGTPSPEPDAPDGEPAAAAAEPASPFADDFESGDTRAWQEGSEDEEGDEGGDAPDA